MRTTGEITGIVACLGAISLGVVDGQAADRRCGRFAVASGNDRLVYRAVVAKGSVRCSTARATLRAFLKGRNVRGRGWDCRNGGRGVRWSVACGAPLRSLQQTFRERNYNKVIKAYYRR
jgi:hypothetical protein